MTAAQGIIYIFGEKIDELAGEPRSELWAYDTSKIF